MTEGILIPASDCSRTTWFTPGYASKLLECDDVSFYKECGWYCVMGYQGRNRMVFCHSNSQEEMESIAASVGVKIDGHMVRPMTEKELMKAREERMYFYTGYKPDHDHI